MSGGKLNFQIFSRTTKGRAGRTRPTRVRYSNYLTNMHQRLYGSWNDGSSIKPDTELSPMVRRRGKPFLKNLGANLCSRRSVGSVRPIRAANGKYFGAGAVICTTPEGHEVVGSPRDGSMNGEILMCNGPLGINTREGFDAVHMHPLVSDGSNGALVLLLVEDPSHIVGESIPLPVKHYSECTMAMEAGQRGTFHQGAPGTVLRGAALARMVVVERLKKSAGKYFCLNILRPYIYMYILLF